ncbi:chitobiase/beta-hexosaminidase C-terminal domain-containing protein [Colwellia sp. TT2012]
MFKPHWLLSWQTYQQPVKVTGPVQVRARTLDKKRAGRTMTVTK